MIGVSTQYELRWQHIDNRDNNSIHKWQYDTLDEANEAYDYYTNYSNRIIGIFQVTDIQVREGNGK
jgi:hypothetical protein